MARSTPPVASRYNGLTVGPRLSVTYETQVGIPVDGTNEQLRTVSPFTITLIPPSLDATSTGASNVLSFSAAATATGSNNRSSAATGLLSTSSSQSYVSDRQTMAAASAPRPAGLGLPPSSILADSNTAADIRVQREFMTRMAQYPLTLLVNPSDMTITREKIQSYQARNRYGYIYQVWGDQLPTVTFSGTTAGFVAGSAKGYQGLTSHDTGSPSGYQWAARRDSAAWQNFAALMQFYRSNGYIHDTLGQSEAHLQIGAISIEYDDFLYEGHIESLNYSFDEAQPHRVSFDMTFSPTRIYDLSPPGGTVATMRNPTSTNAASANAATARRVFDSGAASSPSTSTVSAPTPVRETAHPPLGD